jgi:hypothetical protein
MLLATRDDEPPYMPVEQKSLEKHHQAARFLNTCREVRIEFVTTETTTAHVPQTQRATFTYGKPFVKQRSLFVDWKQDIIAVNMIRST